MCMICINKEGKKIEKKKILNKNKKKK